MSAQVITDIARTPNRQLQKFFNTAGTAVDKTGASRKAVGITAPTSLGGSEIAMGRVGADGILSFFHDKSGGETFTVYYFSHMAEKAMTATKGWILGEAASATYSKAVDQYALATFKLPPGSPWFIKSGTAPIDNLLVSGPEYDDNRNTDNTYNK